MTSDELLLVGLEVVVMPAAVAEFVCHDCTCKEGANFPKTRTDQNIAPLPFDAGSVNGRMSIYLCMTEVERIVFRVTKSDSKLMEWSIRKLTCSPITKYSEKTILTIQPPPSPCDKIFSHNTTSGASPLVTKK